MSFESFLEGILTLFVVITSNFYCSVYLTCMESVIIIIIIKVKINVVLSENASRTRYTIKIKLKLRK